MGKNQFTRIANFFDNSHPVLYFMSFLLFLATLIIGITLTRQDYLASYEALQSLPINKVHFTPFVFGVLAAAPQILQLTLGGYGFALLTTDEGTPEEIEKMKTWGLIFFSIAVIMWGIDIGTDYVYGIIGYPDSRLISLAVAIFGYWLASEVCVTLGFAVTAIMLPKALEAFGEIMGDLLAGIKNLWNALKVRLVGSNRRNTSTQRSSRQERPNRTIP